MAYASHNFFLQLEKDVKSFSLNFLWILYKTYGLRNKIPLKLHLNELPFYAGTFYLILTMLKKIHNTNQSNLRTPIVTALHLKKELIIFFLTYLSEKSGYCDVFKEKIK